MKSISLLIKSMFLSVMIFAAAVSAVEKPKSSQETCVTAECHISFAKKKVVHVPVESGGCQSCHSEVDPAEHTWQNAEQGNELCVSCHDDMLEKANVHEPVKSGECVDCHDPHSSDNEFLLSSSKPGDLCLDCHTITEGMSHLHGPVGAGECSACHNAHSSEHEALLTVEPKELCFSCHDTVKEELEKFEFVHEPAKEDCVSCHNPHGADNSKLLLAESPEMCYSCHDEIEDVVENSKVKHSVVKSKGGCLKCHTPHASTIRYGLKSPHMDLCMGCHDKAVEISKDEKLKAFTKEIKGKKFKHGPVNEKSCEGCHLPHGSEQFRLLAKKYPRGFYSPFSIENYQLCFSCHSEDMVLDAQTEELTEFRNGSQNLHFLHVNKKSRGRTCRSCHAPHASNLEKHIRRVVRYGSWDLPINFSKTETGGRCEPGCHLSKDYDRKSPAKY